MEKDSKKNDKFKFIDIKKLGGDVDFKMDYLEKMKSEYSLRTIQDMYRKFTKHAKFFEGMLSKDLYDFTLEELKILFKGLGRTDIQTLQSDLTMFSKYCLSAQDRGMGIHSISPILSLKRKDLHEFVNTVGEESKLVTENEFYDNLELLINYKDKAMFLLMWKGLAGKTDLYTLVNLKESDIDIENKKIYLTRENEREIVIDVIDTETGEVKKETHKETYIETYIEDLSEYEAYIFEKGLQETHAFSYSAKDELEYVQSLYFFKGVLRKNYKHQDRPVNRQMLNERFRVIKEYLGKESLLKNMGQEFWTPTVLQRCGKIAELIKMKPEWTDNELRKYIAENNIGYNAVSFTRAFRILEEKYKKERIEEINSSSEEVATSYEE